MRNHNRNIIRYLFLTAALIASVLSFTQICAADVVSVTDDFFKEIALISVNESNREISLSVRLNQKIEIRSNRSVDSPPRIVYDLFYDGDPFPSVNRSIENAGLKSIRVGYHPGLMRIVLDLKKILPPDFFHRVKDHDLVITLGTRKESGVKKAVSSDNTADAPDVSLVVQKSDPPVENQAVGKKMYTEAVVKELIKKGDAFLQKGDNPGALFVFEDVIRNYDTLPFITEAEIGAAKALFNMNSFKKSIDLLAGLAQRPGIIPGYPDVLLYLGNNYFQTQNYAGARENLFGYYNISPESKANHLVLSRIGETYRAEGAHEAAAKIYKLVLALYPQTEGALISLTRLAEQQENAVLKTENENKAPAEIIGGEASSPRTIYENIISDSAQGSEKNPMAEFAKLKLAILNRKEKNYAKSLELLLDLLKNYPRSKLTADTIYALGDTFKAVIEDDGGKELYAAVADAYEKKKEQIERYASPELHMAAARAYLRLGQDDRAAGILAGGEVMQPEQEKSGKYTADIYHLKGRMFLKKKEYAKAVEMLSLALKKDPDPEEKISIAADKAFALIAAGLPDDGFAAAREAEKLLEKLPEETRPAIRKIGRLYLDIGRPDEALTLLKRALESEKDEKEKMRLKFAIAGCYQSLDKKSDYMRLYKELAGSNDPLWSRIAGEKMDGAAFNEMLSKKDFRKKRR